MRAEIPIERYDATSSSPSSSSSRTMRRRADLSFDGSYRRDPTTLWATSPSSPQSQSKLPSTTSESIHHQHHDNSSSSSSSPLSFWERSVQWLSSEILNSPSKVFAIGSTTVLLGAYFGYKLPAGAIEQYVSSTGSSSSSTSSSSSSTSTTSTSHMSTTTNANTTLTTTATTTPTTTTTQSTTTTTTPLSYSELDPVTRAQQRAVAIQTARRAFRIATFGTVGTFTVIGGIWLYVVQGYRSLDDMRTDWTSTGKSMQRTLEHYLGGDVAPSKSDPDYIATQQMTEQDQMKYLYDKYIRDAMIDVYEEEKNQKEEDNSKHQAQEKR